MDFFVVKPDGTIVSTGTCPESMVKAQALGNDVAIKGVANIALERYNFKTKKLEKSPNKKILWDEVIHKRNMLLSGCDWTQMPDVPQATQDLWKPYRQALRDITLQPDPSNIAWPTPPV